MLLSRWWSYLLGYVTVQIEGEFVEKLLNMAATRGINIWDISYIKPGAIKVKVRIHGFKRLRHIARLQKCKMKILDKRGYPFILAKLSQRKALVVGAVAFSIILYVLSSFVWFIQIEGAEKVKPEEIRMMAASNGLKIGAAKWDFRPDEVEKAIGNMPQIAWVGVKIKGTKVIIQVAEKVLPDVVADETIPAHLVANNDGLIEEVLVLSGIAAVKPGHVVQRGQILISGYSYENNQLSTDELTENHWPIELNEPVKIRAKGIVKARIWYEETVSVPLEERGYNKTDKFTEIVVVKLGAKEVVVRGPRKIPYIYYHVHSEVTNIPSWRNIKIPIEIIHKTYYKLEPYHYSYTREEALNKAKEEAMNKINAKLPQNIKVVGVEATELTDIAEQTTMQIRYTVETIQDIAEPRAIP